jgi:hypothetical protein
VWLFRCEDASPEIPEISPEIPDFPETPEKSPEIPGFTDKIVLSGDFQDSPIHPPLGDIKILSVPQDGEGMEGPGDEDVAPRHHGARVGPPAR